ncbi:MAG: caspase family protein [Alphaproteobacteria bacterium]|nr:caspase family protein [Alphaproteobacteria bacterium]
MTRAGRAGGLLALVLAGALSTVATAQELVPLRRFALVIGSNDGGPERVTLRYAHTDADSFAHVLTDLGGVAPDDLLVLSEPSRDGITAAFADLSARVVAAHRTAARVEVVVYYSGHSDASGLLPGGEPYSYLRLRTELARLDADVRLAVLDSCASGALVRAKGGIARPAFLTDEASTVRGEAFLTSSTADESSQESDRIGASFFTHHLVTALRGAADADGDGLVTLSEAYTYTFRETRASTADSRIGPQSPYYALDLAGQGDYVMTDLRAATARLELGATLDGALWLRTADGHLFAQVDKVPGKPLVLSVPPGTYQVQLQTRPVAYTARVTVTPGRTAHVEVADLTRQDLFVDGRTRGDTEADPPSRTVHGQFRVAGTPLDSPKASVAVQGVAFHLFGGTVHSLRGGVLGLFGTRARHDVTGAQLTFGYTHAGGDLKGFQGSFFVNDVGGRLAGLQGAGIVNLVHGDSPQSTFGSQLAGVGNIAWGGRKGAQLSTLFNVHHGHLVGAQLAGGVNVAGSRVDGAQLSILGNQARDTVRGLQVSGLFNAAVGMRGAQLALINKAGDGDGVQLGLINVARRMKGFQLGLFNVADELDGEALGLVTIARNGYHAFELWTDDLTPAALGFKFGSKHIYTTLLVGLDPVDDIALSFGGGMGGHATFFDQRLYLDADIVLQTLEAPTGDLATIDTGFVTSLRVMIGGDVAGPFGLWIGPAFRVAIPIGAGAEAPLDTLMPRFDLGNGVQGAVGYQAGLRVRF